MGFLWGFLLVMIISWAIWSSKKGNRNTDTNRNDWSYWWYDNDCWCDNDSCDNSSDDNIDDDDRHRDD